jgi:DNA primase
VALQRPALIGPLFDAVDAGSFFQPAYQAVVAAIAAAGGAASTTGGPEWTLAVREAAADDLVRRLVTELSVEPIRSEEDSMSRYGAQLVARLREVVVARQIGELRSRLQRINPVDEPDRHKKLFGDLIALEGQRRGLREQAIGAL